MYEDANYIQTVGQALSSYLSFKDEVMEGFDDAYNYVPVRAVVGPINDINDYAFLNDEYKEALQEYNKQTAHLGFMAKMIVGDISNLIDGKRSVNEIYDAMYCEKGRADIALIHSCIQLMIKLNLVKIKE